VNNRRCRGLAALQAPIETRIETVMLRLLQQEIDSAHFEQLQIYHPELRGLTLKEVQAFITDAEYRTGDAR
jgi:hypothetical protein